MGRTVPAGILVRDQIDIYNPITTFNRQTGIAASNLVLTLFVNNSLVSWPLADGTTIPDSSISAGIVYFNEIAGSPGFYSIRFFPDQVGNWRSIVKVQVTYAEIIREYDVVPPSTTQTGGLNASFVK